MKTRLKFVIKNKIMSIVIPYLLLLLAVFLIQRSLMYFPEKHTGLQQKELISHLNLALWPGNDNYRGLINSKPRPFNHGTILVFHGNAGSAAGRIYYFDALEKLGYRVIIAEYPGYGTRTGKPSESVFINDGLETAQLALQEFGEPLYLWGESLGGGVLSGIVKTGKVPIAGIVLLFPFDSMSRIAQTHYWYVLGGLLTRDQYNNVKNLQDYTGSIAVILGEKDEVIPNKHTLRLFNSLPGRKKLWTFENAGHNDWPTSPDHLWWQEVMEFVTPDKELHE